MSGPMVGVSGGDTHALRFVAGYEERHPGKAMLIAPPTIAEFVPETVCARMLALRTPLDKWIRNIFVYAAALAVRTFMASARMPRARVATASSHFLNDVIPCVVAKRRHDARVAVFIYHLVGDMDRSGSLRSTVSSSAERVALALLRKHADIVFVDNDEVVSSLRARGFAKDRIVMTANAFDPLVPLPPRTHSEHPILVFCGRFVEEKGIWDVLEIGRILADSAPQVRIEMIGDGPLRDEFTRKLEASGLTNIAVHGFVSETLKWSLLRGASLFIAPSREEGWGIAVGEALTAGTPVIAYDLPAYRYLGDAIERVPAGEVSQFIAAVTSLVDEPERLSRAADALQGATGRLPRWDEILDREYSALGELR